MKKNRAVFLSPHRESFTDSLGEVMREVERRGKYEIIKISSKDLNIKSAFKFFTLKAYYLASAKYIFLNDNFMPMSSLRFSQETVITQLWHAEGVFKKFGMDIPQPEKIRRREKGGAQKLTWVVCSSEDVAQIYAGAFGVGREKVLPLGSPRADMISRGFNTEKIKADLESRCPQLKDKKLILYAPTFRDNEEDDNRLLESVDENAVRRILGEEYELLVRLHPQIHRNKINKNLCDVTDYENVNELIAVCDAVVTDYSSVCMDAAYAGKKMYFYAFDLEKYADERQFYFDYESYVPGPVSKTFEQLLVDIKENRAAGYAGKAEKFKAFNFNLKINNSAEKIVDTIMD